MSQEIELRYLRRELHTVEELRKVHAEEDIVLEGNQYKGRFSAQQKQGRVETGSEYTSAWEYRYYWRGEGIIENKQTGEKHRFSLSTWVLSDGREWAGNTVQHNLEEELVRFKDGWSRVRLERERITNYGAVLDLVLQQMYEDAKSGEDEQIIPKVYPGPLNVKELAKKRLISDSECALG